MNYIAKLFISLIALIFTVNISINAQFKAMAAPGNMKNAVKDVFTKNLPVSKDTSNVYNEMLNDESDDLMENHPASDIYSNIWSSDKINPYHTSLESLPDTVKINCAGFVMPVNGKVTSQFGPRRYRFHYGIDLALRVGDSVRAAFKGKVRLIDYDGGGYGNYIVVRHDNGLETVYAHLSKIEVRPDQHVKAGQIIGLGGNTGRSTGPHLHFETRYVGNALNPAQLIDFELGKTIVSTYCLTKRKSFSYPTPIYRRTATRELAKYYHVKKGDNLSKIAARNGVTVSKLRRINDIDGRIQPGQKLRIR